MLRTRVLGTLGFVLVGWLGLPAAFAYDVDTHFYGTYAMARYCGIRDEVAQKIATSAEWMDESYLTDPTSMILLPITGVKKRRLFHFPSSRIVGSVSAFAQARVFGLDDQSEPIKTIISKLTSIAGYQGDLEALNTFTETEEDHPFASEMLMDGLKSGNLMMAAASLHVIEDSYAHAGTPAEEGHILFWHWPDRPFANPDKYFKMVRSVFMALVAIRGQLPAEALDCTLSRTTSESGGRPNCQLDAKTLAQSYSSEPLVISAVTTNYLKNPDYVNLALQELFTRAAKENYLKNSDADVRNLMQAARVDGKIDAYQALENSLHSILDNQTEEFSNVLNLNFVLNDMGRRRKDATVPLKDYLASYGTETVGPPSLNSQAIHNFVHAIAHDLLKWEVPEPLNDEHRMEVEDDKSPIRAKEMELRIAAMQNAIEQIFGTRVVFIANNTPNESGLVDEINLAPNAEPAFDRAQCAPGTQIATFQAKEKRAWDLMIFYYLFPDLAEKDLVTISRVIMQVSNLNKDLGDYSSRKEAIKAGSKSFFEKNTALLKLTAEYARVTFDFGKIVAGLVESVRPILPVYIHDIVNTHEFPLEDDFFYRNPALLSDYKAQGKLQLFLSEKDAWKATDLLRTPPKP